MLCTPQHSERMKTTAHYLDELKAKLGVRSDGAAGLIVGWTRPATSNYRHLTHAFDNYTCLRVAEALNLPLIQVIADMELQRNHSPERVEPWRKYATKLNNPESL